MSKYMIIYVNNSGDTMAQFGDTIAKLKYIEDCLFRYGIKLVQWYMLNEHNEYVCLSITVMHR